MGDFVDAAVSVQSPATSANLGPGFDSFGLALGLRDVVEAKVTRGGLHIDVSGEGASSVPTDESHLVVRAMRATFDRLGRQQPGLHLVCRNGIPHGRGLGSSAAAIVSGIRLAEALVGKDTAQGDEALALAAEIEGHPDNVAACLAGGFTIAWREADGPRAVRLDVHPDIRPVVFIAPSALSTATARRLLPQNVSHRAASANCARAAVLVAALTSTPQLLAAGTQDALHQEFRREAMPESLALVERLRAASVAAVVSGAGPSVLALGTAMAPVEIERWAPPGWSSRLLAVDPSGARVLAVKNVRRGR